MGQTALPRRSAAGHLRGYAGSLLLVAASTLLGLALAPTWGNSAVDLLYLPAVLAAGVLFGLGPALLAASAAALSYNFFFTAPHLTLRVADPNDVVTIIVLFAVALVTSQLAAAVRQQARIADAHAVRNATIAGLARHLLACTSEQEIAEVTVRELAAIFGCNAVLLRGSPTPTLLASAPLPMRLSPSDLAVAALVRDKGEPAGRGVERAVPTEWQFHPVRSNTSTIAVAGLARDDGGPPLAADRRLLLDNLLDQVALALERARLESEARDFTRLRERDRVRSALLTSIGQDLRPSLQAIADVAAQLRRNGEGDKSLLSSLGSEAAKLLRYLANLLDTPEADLKPLEIDGIAIDLFRRTVFRDGEPVHLTPKEFAILAELAKHPGQVLTHGHLLRTAWGPAQEGQIDYLRVAIRALRQKLERNPPQPELIVNEPAVGYRLKVPNSASLTSP